MNISKNQWMVIGVLGVIAIWYFFLRKEKEKNEESGWLWNWPEYGKKCPRGYRLVTAGEDAGWCRGGNILD